MPLPVAGGRWHGRPAVRAQADSPAAISREPRSECSVVSSALRANAIAAMPCAPRTRARSATPTRSRATPSSRPMQASLRCHARRSCAAGPSAAATARCAALRACGIRRDVGGRPDQRVAELGPSGEPKQSIRLRIGEVLDSAA